jgi:hypothetical protein
MTLFVNRRKTVAKGQNAIHYIACLQLRQTPRTVANSSNQEPQLVALTIKKLMEMGRRRKVDGLPSTRTSTNCPGLMSGNKSLQVSRSST